MNRDQTTNLLLALLAAVGATGGVLWVAAHCAAALVGLEQPKVDPMSGVWALVNKALAAALTGG